MLYEYYWKLTKGLYGSIQCWLVLSLADFELCNLREKYHVLLLGIECLKYELDLDAPSSVEGNLKEAVATIFTQATDIARDLREMQPESIQK